MEGGQRDDFLDKAMDRYNYLSMQLDKINDKRSSRKKIISSMNHQDYTSPSRRSNVFNSLGGASSSNNVSGVFSNSNKYKWPAGEHDEAPRSASTRSW